MFLLTPTLTHTQIFPKESYEISNLIPNNYKLKNLQKGDLNGDTIEDLVLIIKNTKTKKKSIAIYYYDFELKKWKLKSESKNFFNYEDGDIFKTSSSRYQNSDDKNTYEEITSIEIKGQIIIIGTNDGFGNSITTNVKLNKIGKYEIIGIKINSFPRNSFYDVSINFLSSKMKIATTFFAASDNDDDIIEEEWFKILNLKRYNFDDFSIKKFYIDENKFNKKKIIKSKINNSLSENYSIPETIKYINNIANSEYILEFKNNTFITKKYDWVDHRYKKRKQWEKSSEIHLSNISRVSIGEPNMYSSKGSHSSVSIHCKYEDDCAKGYYAYPEYTTIPLFSWKVGNNNNAKKIANALRYIIEKANNSTTNKDPFSKYSKETKDYSKININDLYIGMNKKNVFNTINTKPIVELIELDYEVYKVRKGSDQYFLYFSNNKLNRVDKGESIYDAIIIID
ncbi:hypothetical protein LPB303_14885 [Polaribacter atrinae]|uniref:Uncharacterized protein n=1 Tax=Polaribacter atrinae TaxID=1333662 RepID=A0A176T3V2_9FLAO|nr:hypothetical protein LPB303_14885 [Polaribacter atrinae]